MTAENWTEDLVSVFQQMEEQFAWATNAPLNGLNAYKTDGGWLLIVKTRSVQRGALVSFYGGATLGDCVEQLAYDLHHNPGVTWKADKYGK